LSPKVKTHLYIHDIAFEKHPSFYSLKSRLWYKLIRPKKIYQKATQILTNSEFSKKELLKNYGPQEIQINKPHLKQNWTKFTQNKSKYLLTISGLQPRKNLINLIKGVKLFNQSYPNPYKLLIIGEKETNFAKENYPTDPNIKFLGQVNENTKKNLIQNSEGVLYLSLYEGFGLPILEALTLKKEVLANNIPVFHELYKEHIHYCQASDPNNIATKIKEVFCKTC